MAAITQAVDDAVVRGMPPDLRAQITRAIRDPNATGLSRANTDLLADNVAARVLNDQLLSTVVRENFIDTQKKRSDEARFREKVYIDVFLHDSQKVALSDGFKEFNIIYRGDSRSSHPAAMACRTLSIRMLERIVGYRPHVFEPTAGYHTVLKDVGGNPLVHANRGHDTVHTCFPLLDVADTVRHAAHITALNQFNERNRKPAVVQCYERLMKADPLMRCTSMAQDCPITAPLLIFCHSTYDMTPNSMVKCMRSARAHTAAGCIDFHPMVLTRTSGKLPFTGANYRRYIDPGSNRQRIKFWFDNDTQYAYDHDYAHYTSILNASVVHCGDESYVFSLVDERCDALFFRIARHQSGSLPSLRGMRVLTDDSLRDYIVLRTFKWETITVTDSLFEYLFGLRPFDNTDPHMQRSSFIVPRTFYNRLFNFSLGMGEQFNTRNLLRAAHSYNTREVVDGQSIGVPRSPALSPSELLWVSETIYMQAYMLQYQGTKLIAELVNDEKNCRLGSSFLRRLLTRAFDRNARNASVPLDDYSKLPADEDFEAGCRNVKSVADGIFARATRGKYGALAARKYPIVALDRACHFVECGVHVRSITQQPYSLARGYGDVEVEQSPAPAEFPQEEVCDCTEQLEVRTNRGHGDCQLLAMSILEDTEVGTIVDRLSTSRHLLAIEDYPALVMALQRFIEETDVDFAGFPATLLHLYALEFDRRVCLHRPSGVCRISYARRHDAPLRHFRITHTASDNGVVYGHVDALLPTNRLPPCVVTSSEDTEYATPLVDMSTVVDAARVLMPVLPPARFASFATAQFAELRARGLTSPLSRVRGDCTLAKELRQRRFGEGPLTSDLVYPTVTSALADKAAERAWVWVRRAEVLEFTSAARDRFQHVRFYATDILDPHLVGTWMLMSQPHGADYVPRDVMRALLGAWATAALRAFQCLCTSVMPDGTIRVPCPPDAAPRCYGISTALALAIEREVPAIDPVREILGAPRNPLAVLMRRHPQLVSTLNIVVTRPAAAVILPRVYGPLNHALDGDADIADGEPSPAAVRDTNDRDQDAPRFDTAVDRVCRPIDAAKHVREIIGDVHYNALVEAATYARAAVDANRSNYALALARFEYNGNAVELAAREITSAQGANPDDYTHMWYKGDFVPFQSGVPHSYVGEYCKVLNDIPVITSLLELSTSGISVRPRYEFTQAGPGCGKTHSIVTQVPEVDDYMVLCATTAGRDMVRNRLRTTAAGPTVGDRVRTVVSCVMHCAGRITASHVFIDEAMMVHPGIIVACAVALCAHKVYLFGDLLQIPFINRVPRLRLVYDRHDWLFPVTRYLSESHRITRDSCAILAPYYAAVGMRLTTRNRRTNTLKFVRIEHANAISDIGDNTALLTFLQQDKDALSRPELPINRGAPRDVHTVHEFQGSEADKVAIVRLNNCSAHDLWNSRGHLITALSRHKEQLTYYSVLPSDPFTQFMKL